MLRKNSYKANTQTNEHQKDGNKTVTKIDTFIDWNTTLYICTITS
jgi:hypothetical protein